MSIISKVADERFLDHRRRSTMIGGQAGCLLAIGLFLYHDLKDHVWNWELLGIALTVVGVKLLAMAWYLLRD